MSRKQLLKLKAELDAFDLKSQQNILELLSINLQIQKNQLEALSIWFEMKKEVERPIISVEEHPSRESNEVDFNLPPVFDDYGEEETEEKVAENQEEHQKEIEEKVEEDKIPLFPFELHKTKPQNSHDHLNPFLPCGKPLLEAPNSKFRASKELDTDVPKVIPQNQIQISKGNECKRVFKTKQDLFTWLILFQPSPCHPTFFFLILKPLKRKFCHKDKWKEPTLVL